MCSTVLREKGGKYGSGWRLGKPVSTLLGMLVARSTEVSRTGFPHRNAKRMPQDVQDSLQSVCEKWGGLSAAEAHAYLTSLATSRRLQLETWS